MAVCPDYYTNLSLILSRVMDDVGVNDECVLKRRRTNLVAENIYTLSNTIQNENYTEYIFGSQTEGTTTVGLNSDIDILNSIEDFNVIQDWKDWELGKSNLLMLRDERLYPGHCKLQVLYKDVPLPLCVDDCPDDERFSIDSDGNVIMGRKFICVERCVRHGPADTYETFDLVQALRCRTWPQHYKQLTCTRRGHWPTPEMIQHIRSTGCFVVKAAHRLDDRDETWRISTSLAERCLMFSLNITQIRCYVLLKMIVKTFIQPRLPDTISSYMCKTLLFHSIENTHEEFWKEHNLLQCVHQVLLYMIAAVLDEYCPNYFNENANLFLGKIDVSNKMDLLSILRFLLKYRGKFLLGINFDNIGHRLVTYINDINYVVSQEERDILRLSQCKDTMDIFYETTISRIQKRLRMVNFKMSTEAIVRLDEYARFKTGAFRLFQPFMCSFFATMEASQAVLQNIPVNPSTLKLFDLSLNSDVSSSRLKFASYLYCTGQLERTLSVLQDVEERMTDNVMMMCGCHVAKYPPGFLQREASQKYPKTDKLALCVMFSIAESPCCPRELQYEIFRSTKEEKRNRDDLFDAWMDLVVVDSLPYLYYLQYMTYRHLGHHDQQYTALNKLSDCVRNNEYLTHRETAYNVLGQCMEYEGLLDDSIECYRRSLSIRPNNNAVRWHIVRLIGRATRQAVPGTQTSNKT